MKRIYNYLRGSAKIEIDGACPEQFLNEAANAGVEFWSFDKTAPDKAALRVPRSALGALAAAAEAAKCSCTVAGKYGLPELLYRLRRRWALFAGLALCLLAVPVMSLFVWEIDVTGNETVTDGQILSVLQDLGVRIGMFGLDIDQQDLRNRALSRLGDLSWLTVNVVGTKAEVIVRERVKKPEILDVKLPTDVIAKKSGVVARMSVYQGKPAVTEGSTVMKGDLLVGGLMSSLKSGDRLVHASADVYARTWYELTDEIPLEYIQKDYTGDEKVNRALIIAGKRINLYFKSGFSDPYCDKIIKTKKLVLPGGYTLPIALVTEESRVYTPRQAELDAAAAEQLLKDRLTDRLKGLIDGTVTSAEFETRIRGGALSVTLRAECREQIGEPRRIS